MNFHKFPWFITISLFAYLGVILPCYSQEERYISEIDSILKHLTRSGVDNSKIETILDSISTHSENIAYESIVNAFILHKKGVIRGRMRDHPGAIKFYKRALDIRKKLYANDPNPKLLNDIINGYGNISARYLYFNDYHSSLKFALEGLDLVATSDPNTLSFKRVLRLSLSVARSYSSLGDYDNSLKYYLYTYNNSHKSSSDHNEIMYVTLIESSVILSNRLFFPDSALSNLKESRKLLNSIPKRYLMNDYLNTTTIYIKSNKIDEAEDYTREALKKGINEASMNYSVILKYRKKFDSAVYHLNISKDLFLKDSAYLKLSGVYDNLSDVYFLNKNFKEAIASDNMAMSYLLKTFKPATLLSNPDLSSAFIPDKLQLLKSLDSKGEALLALYQQENDPKYLEAAVETYQLADQVIGRIRSDFVAEASKFSLARQTKPIYNRGIEACWELFQLEEDPKWIGVALNFSEQSRSMVLLDALRKSRAKQVLSQDLIQQENELNLRINYLEKQLALQESPALDSLLFYQREHTAVKEQIRQEHPEYFKLIFDPGRLNVDLLREELNDDQSILEYFIHEQDLYMFHIKTNRLEFKKLEMKGNLQEIVEELDESIKTQKSNFTGRSHQLYQILISPLEPLNTRLVIIPDHILHHLNFEVLLTSNPSDNNLPDLDQYLIHAHRISYAYSLSSMMESSEKENSSEPFLGIAPGFNQAIQFNGIQYGALSFNLFEVEEIQKLMGGETWNDHLNNDALQNGLSDYQLIHFATHARANDKNGDLSMILLSEEQPLYAKDIYVLPLNAEMVVLSGCETNAGSLHPGEGIVSLARSFAYAGVPSIITSLWNVHEKPNKEIIIKFYQGLKEGMSKDQALREAKLSYLENISPENIHLKHPYFWAPMVCVGDVSPIHRSYAGIILFISGLIALVLLTLVFSRSRKSS